MVADFPLDSMAGSLWRIDHGLVLWHADFCSRQNCRQIVYTGMKFCCPSEQQKNVVARGAVVVAVAAVVAGMLQQQHATQSYWQTKGEWNGCGSCG